MSRSRKSEKQYLYKHHHKVCTKWVGQSWPRTQGSCVCDGWHDYHWYGWPAPSWWNREQAHHDKVFIRNKMQRARTGHLRWEDVDTRRGREYYW